MTRKALLFLLLFLILSLVGSGRILANPYLDLPPQQLTEEELHQIAPWYDTAAKPLDRMLLDEIVLTEVDESWVFIILTYRDKTEGSTLDTLLFGERAQLFVNHATLRGSVDLSLIKYFEFLLEPAIYFPETNVLLGIIGSIPRSYARQFLNSTVLR